MKNLTLYGNCMHTGRQFAKHAVMLLVTLVVGAGIQANAADVTAYTNGSKTEFTKSALTYGSLATADSITVTGTWTGNELSTLRHALKSDGDVDTENSTLKSANLSAVILSGNQYDNMSGSNGFFCMFGKCTALEKVTFPATEQNNEVTINSVFQHCYKLKTIENLDKLTNLVSLNSAFWECKSLTLIKFSQVPNTNLINCYYTFNDCNSLTNIDNFDKFENIDNLKRTFCNCSSLKTIKFSETENNNLISFNKNDTVGTFFCCYQLESIINLNKFTNLTENGLQYAFYNCSSLRFFTFYETTYSKIISLRKTFYGCSNLESVANLNNLTNITSLNSTFRNCSKLKSVHFSSNVNNNRFSTCRLFENCINLDTVTNLDKFTNISDMEKLFQNCSKLTEVRLGSDPSNLPESNLINAFDSVNCLKYLPSSVTAIPTTWEVANYNNFVLPITISIAVPEAVEEGNALTLPVPMIAETYCARKDTLWQLATDSTFTDAITYAAGTAVTCTQNGYYLRCGVTAPTFNPEIENDTTYFSNSVQIMVEAPTATPIVSAGQVRIFSDQETLVIEGLAIGEPYAVYDAAGRYLVNAVSTENEVRLSLPAGIYVVSTAHTTQKVIK